MSASRDFALDTILETRLIAVVRMTSSANLPFAVEALRRGGVRAIEITLTTPGAIDAIRDLSLKKTAGEIVGAGTVLDVSAAARAMDAGADFVVTPVLDTEVIRACRGRDVLVSSGGLTPTEILAAWRAGADVVKVFPATSAGPKYFKDLKGPFPEIRLMPTGGVTLENAPDFIRCGACCVALGTSLLAADLVRSGNWNAITERAVGLLKALHDE
jgi:2-dehydro-3-deoxyphosphogluconate aldolase/(4S)-4-hydroxy-2-oxoglutarate aldolase